MKHPDFDARYDGYLYHYYRAEVSRETNWRNRLDVTTNWSIVVTAANLSYMFGNANVAHSAIVLNYLIVLFFLYIESRRFRYYTMLKDRTRMIEAGFLSKVFYALSDPNTVRTTLDLAGLAKNLEHPKTTMSKLESIAWRARRVYIFLLGFLYITWLAKVSFSPSRASVLFLPGWFVMIIFTFSFLALLFIAIYLPLKSVGDDLP